MKILGEELGNIGRWYIVLPPLLLIGFLIGLFFLAAAGQSRLNAADERVHNSEDRQRALDEFFGLFSDAESEQRGFLFAILCRRRRQDCPSTRPFARGLRLVCGADLPVRAASYSLTQKVGRAGGYPGSTKEGGARSCTRRGANRHGEADDAKYSENHRGSAPEGKCRAVGGNGTMAVRPAIVALDHRRWCDFEHRPRGAGKLLGLRRHAPARPAGDRPARAEARTGSAGR